MSLQVEVTVLDLIRMAIQKVDISVKLRDKSFLSLNRLGNVVTQCSCPSYMDKAVKALTNRRAFRMDEQGPAA